MIGIQEEEIRVDDLLRAVRSARCGAVVLFLGTVRDHNRGRKVLHLEYQAYAEMAESEMRESRRNKSISSAVLIWRSRSKSPSAAISSASGSSAFSRS